MRYCSMHLVGTHALEWTYICKKELGKSSNSKTSSFIYLEMHQSQHEIKMDPIYLMLVSGLIVNDSSVHVFLK